MNGRVEHSVQVNDYTKKQISSLPLCVSDYYYSMSASTEPHTRREYMLRIKNFLQYTNCPIDQITDRMVAEYFDKLNEGSQRKRGKALSSSYQQLTWCALNGFFSYLMKRGEVQKNPMELYKYPKTKTKIKRVALDITELNKTLEAVQEGVGSQKAKATSEKWKERDYLMLYMLMNTGMRSEMLCEINVEDLDFAEHRFVVVAKGGKEMEYTITPKMETLIKEWLVKREKLLAGVQCDALFISCQRRRLGYQGLRLIVNRYTEVSGKRVSPHKLRASFITNFYEASGHDMEATKIAAGHARMSTTERYIAGKDSSRRDAQKYMDTVLG